MSRPAGTSGVGWGREAGTPPTGNFLPAPLRFPGAPQLGPRRGCPPGAVRVLRSGKKSAWSLTTFGLVLSPTCAPAGKVELHGKPVEVEHSVPKRQR